MYKMHNWSNNNAPPINDTNLNEMEVGIASGYTYVASCSSGASASAKTLTISDFATSVMTASPGQPFVLYVRFTNGSTSDTMTIKINSGTARNVNYRSSTSGISALKINANDVVAFVYDGTVYHLLGAISIPPSDLITPARGGTGRTTLTSNAILAGNGASNIKMIATASGAFFATSANGAAQFGTLPIAQGGTGATAAATARTNLGVPTIYKGTGNPSASTGANGDLYFKYTS